MVSKYVGKQLPPGVEAGGASPAELPTFKPISAQAARNILGLNKADTYKQGLQKWHECRKEAEQLGDAGKPALLSIDLAWRSICSSLP